MTRSTTVVIVAETEGVRRQLAEAVESAFPNVTVVTSPGGGDARSVAAAVDVDVVVGGEDVPVPEGASHVPLPGSVGTRSLDQEDAGEILWRSGSSAADPETASPVAGPPGDGMSVPETPDTLHPAGDGDDRRTDHPGDDLEGAWAALARIDLYRLTADLAEAIGAADDREADATATDPTPNTDPAEVRKAETGDGSDGARTRAIQAGIRDGVAPTADGTIPGCADDAGEEATFVEKVTRLHAGVDRLIAASSPEELYEVTIDVARDVLSFDTCFFGVVEDGQFVPTDGSLADSDAEARPLALDHGILGDTYRTGETIHVDDTREHARAVPIDESFRSAVSVPIPEVGVFQALSTTPGAFDERDRELAELLVAHVQSALMRIRAERRLRDQRETITALHEWTAEMVGADTERGLEEMAIDAAEQLLEFDICYFARVEDDRFVPTTQSSVPTEEGLQELSLDHGVTGATYQRGESFLIDDLPNHPIAEPVHGEYQSAISVPVGEYGVFQAVSKEPAWFDEVDIELAELLLSHVAETLERMGMEAELRDREAALRTERDRFAALFENVPDPIAAHEVVDDTPIVREVNEPFEEVFGYDADTVVDDPIDEYLVSPEDPEKARMVAERLQSGERFQTEIRCRTADGVRDFILHVVPLAVDERTVEGFSIYTDITDQKRRQRELARKNDRLEEFASFVSHDLRNPLNVAEGFLELAREDGDPEHFEKVARAHARMGRLIDDLLTLARQGEDVAEEAAVVLPAIAKEAWRNVDTGDATLEVGAELVIEADEERLLALLENCFRNAIEHGAASVVRVGELGAASTPGNPEGTSTGGGSTDDGSAAGFVIDDDGCGIPEADREAVFDSGYTTNPAGTGLGLTIVERIAAAHGWSATATDGSDGGARLAFSGVTVLESGRTE